MKQKQNVIQQNKKYLKTKLLECQKVLHEHRIEFNNGQSAKDSIIKDRAKRLLSIKEAIHNEIQMDALQRDIAIIQQMYLFTVNFADLHSLRATLVSLGEFVDFA